MNSAEWADIENVRNQAIAQLAEICAAMGLSWSAGSKEFVISLPDIIVNKAVANISIPLQPTKRKTFDISTWGEPGPVEGLPDDMQLPDYGEMLDEGEAPKGDPNREA